MISFRTKALKVSRAQNGCNLRHLIMLIFATATAYEPSDYEESVLLVLFLKTKLASLLMAVAAFFVLAGAIIPASAQVVVKVGQHHHHRRHHRHYQRHR
jgi:hypothetical protein